MLMKKQVAIAMGLAVLSTGALASKARLEALGQDANGSQYLDDVRSVLLNPAMLNYHKDFVTLEWGNTNQEGATTLDRDATATPKAEGGMFKAAGNMVYGLYFGSESNTSNTFRTAAGVMTEQNNTDFFIAGDAGVQWGVRLTYHSFEDEQAATEDKSDAMRAVLGVISGDTEAFLNFGISNKVEETSGQEFEGKSSIDLGITHGMGDVDYMVRYQSIQAEESTTKDEVKVNNIHLGVAKNYKLNDKATAWASAWYKMDKAECDGANTSFQTAICKAANNDEKKDNYLPIIMGVEVMAKEWLTLRGSVTHNIMGTTENGAGDKKTMEDTTEIAAGASLMWGDLALDGVIGNSNAGANASATDTSAGQGNLRSDNLMSRVSLTYKF